MTTGMVQEITNLYVKINDVKYRYTYLDGVDMTKVGDIVEYEADEQETKTDPPVKIFFLKPKTFHRADTPRAADAFVTGDKIVREEKAQGVVVTETVKKPVEPVKDFVHSGPEVTKDGLPTERTPPGFLQGLFDIRKDILISRQVCLKAAVDISLQGESPEEIIKIAYQFEQWVLRK